MSHTKLSTLSKGIFQANRTCRNPLVTTSVNGPIPNSRSCKGEFLFPDNRTYKTAGHEYRYLYKLSSKTGQVKSNVYYRASTGPCVKVCLIIAENLEVWENYVSNIKCTFSLGEQILKLSRQWIDFYWDIGHWRERQNQLRFP